VSALDVSVQAQIVTLLRNLRREHGASYLLIAHNLAMVRYIADRVAVMYLGQIVEQAPSPELYANPQHPYTRALFSSALPADPDAKQDDIVLAGEPPTATDPPPGCRFHTRCPFVMDICRSVAPTVREITPDHVVACHLYTEPPGRQVPPPTSSPALATAP